MSGLFLKFRDKFSRQKRIPAGFSLVETIVAVTLIALAVTGPIVLAEKSLSAAKFSRDQLIAVHLASEALDYVRLLRDDAALNKRGDWLYGLNQCDSSDGNKKCGVDPHNNAPGQQVVSCQTDSACDLFISSGFYSHQAASGNSPTAFNRTVSLIKRAGSGQEIADERTIVVTVKMKRGPFSGSEYKLRSVISNWKEAPSDKFNF